MQVDEEDLYSAVARGPNAAGPWRQAARPRKPSLPGGPAPPTPPHTAAKPIPTPAAPQLQPQAQPQAIPSATAVAGGDGVAAGEGVGQQEGMLEKGGLHSNGLEASSAPTPQVPNAWNRAGSVPLAPESLG